MHYYSHHIGDLIRDTANLDDHQLVTYMRMIWAYYQSEQPLENNLEDIAFAMRSDEKTVRLLLRHYFVLDGNLWRHTRCDKEIANYHSKSEKASKSAKTRWTKTDLVPMDNEGNANALEKDANASKSDANQEPRTKNQEPIIKEKKAQALVVLFELPDWIPSDAWAGFVEMRKHIKKPMTDRAIDLKIKDLSRFQQKGYDLAAILDKSTANNWSDLYEPKPQDKAYETPYAKSMREKYEQITPLIAAKNPNAPRKINPNDFINGKGISDHERIESPKLAIVG